MTREKKNGAKEPRLRQPLNRDRILIAAMEIADENGVNAVTMREVASRLNVEAMSLYNHVSGKEDILDGMVDLVIEQFDLPDGATDWRKAMRQRALSAHTIFSRHPWTPPLLDSRKSSGPSRLRYYDWVLGTLMKAGFSVAGAGRAFSLLDSYIYGFSIQQANLAAGSDGPAEQMAEEILKSIPEKTYPNLYRMVIHSIQSGYDAEDDFTFGLEIILEGLEKILHTRP